MISRLKKPSQTFLIFSSAFLLVVSFPKFNCGFAAWIALVPAFVAVQKTKSFHEAFVIFYLIGFVFFFLSIEWLRYVTYFGWIFVCFLYAFFFGIFGGFSRLFLKSHRFTASFLMIPAFWVVLEWIRCEVPVTAFGWNLLGYSQSDYHWMAQLASVLGVYGVSFLIVFFNLSVWLLICSFHHPEKRRRAIRRVGYTVFMVLVVMYYGVYRSHPDYAASTPLSVGVVQGNVPQSEKWDPEYRESIIDRYEKLSEFVVYSNPDLIVWPESAWPGVFNIDSDRGRLYALAKRSKIPFLIGSPYQGGVSTSARLIQPGTGRNVSLYNSAYLIDSHEARDLRYDKIQLVPFGEFIPLQFLFRTLGLEKYAYSRGIGDFSPGKEPVVFDLQSNANIRFSSLICFENTFPALARTFVDRGAQFLVVLTNDAWFGESAAPYQHLQASIFRAIEEGVPVIHVANTGVSAFISADGRVMDRVKNKQGYDTWIAGGLTHLIALIPYPTLYRTGGYYFPLLCLVIVLGTALAINLTNQNHFKG